MGLPRPRGDGPSALKGAAITVRAPPPTRGWTLVTPSLHRSKIGSPAHAGMDPDRLPRRIIATWLPRPRGDGPRRESRFWTSEAAPPPTRGWTLAEMPAPRGQHGSPAHAGMDPEIDRVETDLRGLPRPRGDGPSAECAGGFGDLAPPPTRGWTWSTEDTYATDTGSPAHAGMDPTRCAPPDLDQWLPRPRGDGPEFEEVQLGWLEAPPPTRGWTRHAASRSFVRRGSPAHAGMDPGESEMMDTERGSPAHAGMDPGCSDLDFISGGLPRPRGDGPRVRGLCCVAWLAPPPTRGWTLQDGIDDDGARGSPAHAGMDLPDRCSRAPDSRLPRPRGDGPWSPALTLSAFAAPPPTRGWTLQDGIDDDGARGSPAHAGMDLGARP